MKLPVLLDAQCVLLWKKDEGPAGSVSSSYAVPLAVTVLPPEFIRRE